MVTQCDSIYIILLLYNFREGTQVLGVVRGLRCGRDVGMGIKGQRKDLRGSEAARYLDSGGGHTSLHR